MHSGPAFSSTEIDVDSEYTPSNGGYRKKGEPFYRPSRKDGLFRKDKPLRNDKPMRRKVGRSVGLVLFAVLVGVGGTLAGQAYRDEIVQVFPAFGWFSSVSTIKAANPAVTSADLQGQLRPLAIDVALVRRSIEQLTSNLDQLARKQDQLTQYLATLQAAEQGVRPNVSAPPLPPKTVYAPPPPTK